MSKDKDFQSPFSHSCDHSYYRSSLKDCDSSARDRILKLVNESEIELAPIQIAVRTGVNHATVRHYVRILLKEGEILQPYNGAYCNKRTHGVRFAPLRFHNVVLSVSAPWLDFHDDYVETCGSVKIRITYGVERRKITGTISCDRGMDQDTLFLALDRFFTIVERRTNKSVEKVVVRTFEANRDYAGVRLDSVQCVTKYGLYDALERIYQKETDVVRHEFKISRPMNLEEFSALIQGGASSYNIQQGLFMLVQKFESLIEATKFQNGVLKAVYDKLLTKGNGGNSP